MLADVPRMTCSTHDCAQPSSHIDTFPTHASGLYRPYLTSHLTLAVQHCVHYSIIQLVSPPGLKVQSHRKAEKLQIHAPCPCHIKYYASLLECHTCRQFTVFPVRCTTQATACTLSCCLQIESAAVRLAVGVMRLHVGERSGRSHTPETGTVEFTCMNS